MNGLEHPVEICLCGPDPLTEHERGSYVYKHHRAAEGCECHTAPGPAFALLKLRAHLCELRGTWTVRWQGGLFRMCGAHARLAVLSGGFELLEHSEGKAPVAFIANIRREPLVRGIKRRHRPRRSA